MDKLFLKYEKILRNVSTQQKILKSIKRVNTFKGSDVSDALIKKDLNNDQIKELMTYLLLNNIIFKVEIDKKNKNNCDVLLDYRFSENDYYIWTEEKSSHLSLFICLGLILLGLGLVMFQMWPSKLRVVSSYVSYLIGGFIIFLMVLGVIRLIIFSITYFSHPPGIWLFPNLFADCGFIESFIPLYAFHGDDYNSKEKEE